MAWRVAFAAAVFVASTVHAHPGPPRAGQITFRQEHETDIAADTSFGLLLSHDGGATWSWMCESAMDLIPGYVPDYAYPPSGVLFATGFHHPLAMRDGCTFGPIEGEAFSALALGPDHALYMAAVGAGDARVYKSTDDGVTFPVVADAGQVDDWYTSLAVAPTDANRVYLAALRVEPNFMRSWQLYASRDGGQTFASINIPGLVSNPDASIKIAGVERGAPDTLYLNVDGGGVWRSTDTGATWAEIYATTGLSKPVLLVRANGDLILADDYAHAWISHDRGDHWIPLAALPHVSCLVENAAGEVWACTQTLADGAAIMKTTDLASWTPVLRLQDIVGPVACPAGTTQADQCAAGEWCTLAGQLGVMDPTCPMIIPPSSDPGDGTEGDEPTQAAGPCAASSSPSLLMFGIAAVVLATRRRRR